MMLGQLSGTLENLHVTLSCPEPHADAWNDNWVGASEGGLPSSHAVFCSLCLKCMAA